MPYSDKPDRRALVQRLSGRLAARGATKLPPRFGYVSFGPPAPSPSPRRSAARTPLRLEIPRFDSWESLLAWAIKTGPVHSGFVVNSEGFVIAVTGTDVGSRCDGLGADLCVTFDEMRSANPDGGALRSLCLMFEKHWLIALQSSHPRPVTVGLIATGLDPRFVDVLLQGMAESHELIV